MKYEQSRMATKIEFNFGEDELEYFMEDNNGTLNFEVGYGSLPKRTQKFYERNLWLRNVGFIWVIIGIFLTALRFIQDGNLALNFWVWIGTGCLAFYRYTWTDYVYYDTDQGRVLVLNDHQLETILNELKTRRKTAYMTWFDSLEFNGDQGAMQKTLKYMVKEDAMTETEAEQRLAILKNNGQPKLIVSNDEPPKKLN